MLKIGSVVGLCLFLSFFANIHAKNTYDGYKLVGVSPQTQTQVDFLNALKPDYEFWSTPSLKRAGSIVASPTKFAHLISLIGKWGIEYTIKSSDIGSLLEQESRHVNKRNNGAPRQLTWNEYHTYEEISAWIDDVVSESEVAYVGKIGNSFENKEIKQVYITSGPDDGNKAKPAIYIDANIHGNEWITSAVATYIINELTMKTENYTEILDEFDFYIVPILNPDGFVFSHSAPENRQWRKSRRLFNDNPCIGVDLNRNFEYYFGGESTSEDPCDDQYKGTEFFSEPETKALSDDLNDILENRTSITAYYTLHSYGNLWLLPWGYTNNSFPIDYKDLHRWAALSAEAIRDGPRNTTYDYGQGAELLGGVGGAGDDYAKFLGIKYVTTVEISDEGTEFVVLPELIEPIAQEVWRGIHAILPTTVDNLRDSGANSFQIKNWFIVAQLVAFVFYYI